MDEKKVPSRLMFFVEKHKKNSLNAFVVAYMHYAMHEPLPTIPFTHLALTLTSVKKREEREKKRGFLDIRQYVEF